LLQSERGGYFMTFAAQVQGDDAEKLALQADSF
jgi:hypothetical protein